MISNIFGISVSNCWAEANIPGLEVLRVYKCHICRSGARI